MRYSLIAATSVAILSASEASAASTTGMARCRGIADPQQRLACYDSGGTPRAGSVPARYAADPGASVAVPATVPAKRAFTWSGFYLGFNAGGGWRNQFYPPGADAYPGVTFAPNETVQTYSVPVSFTVPLTYTVGGTTYTQNYTYDSTYTYSVPYTYTSNSSYEYRPGGGRHAGGTGGFSIDYNYQINDWLVVGAEYDINYIDISNRPDPRVGTVFTVGSGSSAPSYYVLNYDTHDGDSNRWLGLARARLGATFDRVLFYGTAGAAYRFSYDYSDPFVTSPTGITYYSGHNRTPTWGFAYGGGIEYAITDSISIKGEYLRLDFGKEKRVDPVASTVAGVPVVLSKDRHVDIVRAGINFRFSIDALGSLSY